MRCCQSICSRKIGGAIETTKGPGNLSNETAVSLFRCFGVFWGLGSIINHHHNHQPSTIITDTGNIDHRPSTIDHRGSSLITCYWLTLLAGSHRPHRHCYIKGRSASQQDARRQSPFVVVFASCKWTSLFSRLGRRNLLAER
jgi:hypothetical protein